MNHWFGCHSGWRQALGAQVPGLVSAVIVLDADEPALLAGQSVLDREGLATPVW